MSRANQWFVPGNDIAREVITADIQRYLGPDALVRPGVGTGDYLGQPGYWITAYRTLTSQMIQDLRMDSQRWQQERQPEAGRSGGVAYQDSQTHAARQHWGPTTPYDTQQAPPHSQSSRGAYDDRRDPKQTSRSSYQSSAYGQTGGHSGHYTTTPTPYEQSAYTNPSSEPRTTPQAPSYYQQQPAQREPAYPAQQRYPTQPTDPYARSSQSQSTGQYPPSQGAAPGYYIASDGNQYPLSQQPTGTQRSSGGGGRGYSSGQGTTR